jgi:hypothetical protein
LGQFSKNELFIKKIVKKLLKIWSWDPGSGKNLFRIPDPGVKKAPDPGSGSATLFTTAEKNAGYTPEKTSDTNTKTLIYNTD